jgi:hypothetical protein
MSWQSRALRCALGAGLSYVLATLVVLVGFAALPQGALHSLRETGFFWTVLAVAAAIFLAGSFALRARKDH